MRSQPSRPIRGRRDRWDRPPLTQTNPGTRAALATTTSSPSRPGLTLTDSGWGRPRPPTHELSQAGASSSHTLPRRDQGRVGTLNWSMQNELHTQQGAPQIPSSRWTPPEGQQLTRSIATDSSTTQKPKSPPDTANQHLSTQTSNTPKAKREQPNVPPPTNWGWSRSQLNTPLNRMGVGSSARWTKTNERVSVALPSKPPSPFPRSHLDSLAESMGTISSYGSITGRSRPNISKSLPGTPTPTMISLGAHLRKIPRGDLTHSDFINNMSSEGVSVLVAILLEDTDTTTWSEMLAHNVAHTLLTLAPDTLRGYFKTPEKIEMLAHSLASRTDKIPTFEEDCICPALVPDVVKDRTLRSRCTADDLARKDCMGIIAPYLRRFYPYSAIRALKALASVEISSLVSIIQVPGFFPQMWRGSTNECVFDPPRWVTLAIEDNPTPQADVSAQIEMASDDEPISEFDGFSPIKLLGLPQEEAEALPLDALRAKTLQSLPPILTKLLSVEETAQFVISFATSPLDDLRRLLSPEGFCSKLNSIRGILDPPPLPWRVFRIRLHVLNTIRQWGSYNELVRVWVTAVSTLMSALGFSIFLHIYPHDPTETPLPLPVDPTLPLSEYAHSRKGTSIGTCDIWCSTSFLQWGQLLSTDSFLGPSAASYIQSLAQEGLRADCRESFTFGLLPIVAIIGSDRRDRPMFMIEEYTNSLRKLESTIPLFEIEWLSVSTPKRERHVMVQCVMATTEHYLRVKELFQRLERMTLSSDSHLITKFMHLLFFPTLDATIDDTQGALDRIWVAQTDYEQSHTCVIITEIPGVDPFDTPLPRPNSDSNGDTPLSIAHTILMGGILDKDEESFDIPITKLTTDTAFTRYYLYAHVDDARALISHGCALLQLLSACLRPDTPFRLSSREAQQYIPTPTQSDKLPHNDTQPRRTDSSVEAMLDSELLSMMHSMNKTITDMGREITSIKEHLHPSTIAEDVISAVQSSITTTAKDLHSATHTSTETFINHLMQHVQSYSWDIGTICHELNSSHAYSRSVLQDLVDRYDATALGSYDGTMAFGNELVMLRLAVTACAKRINLLIAGHPHIPQVPLGDKNPMSPTTASRAMDAIHHDYTSGVDLTSMVAVSDDPTQLNKLTQDTSFGTQTPTVADTETHTSASHQTPSTQPILPLSTHTPTHAPTTDLDPSGRLASPTSPDTHGPSTSTAVPSHQFFTTPVPDLQPSPVNTELAVQDASSENNSTPPTTTQETLPPDTSTTTNTTTKPSHTTCHACDHSPALAVCECCSSSYCNTCVIVESPHGWTRCGPCHTQEVLRTSSTDTSEAENRQILHSPDNPALLTNRETPTRRSRSRSGSTLDSKDSSYSLSTLKSTSRSRRCRPRRRS
jgi:hypothetical protein